MSVALPIGNTSYKRWPRFGDVIGHPDVARRYLYLGMAPLDGNHHKVLVIAGPGIYKVGQTTIVTDTNIGQAVILEEGPA